MNDALRGAPVQPTRTLQELVLGGHLEAPLPLTVLDVADWTSRFADFPVVQELPPLAPAALPVPGTPQEASIAIGMGPALPRMLLRSPDGRMSIQMQGDRFAVGWSRIEPIGSPADYPGFEAMLAHWGDLSSRFEAWAGTRLRSQPRYRLVEVSYSNATPLERDGQRKRIGDIFRFVQPGLRPVNMFATQWAERVYPNEDASNPFKAIVHSHVGIGQAPPAISVLGFNFHGLGAVAAGQQCAHIMRDLHGKIREIYQSVIISDGS